jgi:hypothetical protein
MLSPHDQAALHRACMLALNLTALPSNVVLATCDGSELPAASGEVTRDEILRAPNYEPAPNGLFATDIFGTDEPHTAGVRCGRLRFAHPMVHPLLQARALPWLAQIAGVATDHLAGLLDSPEHYDDGVRLLEATPLTRATLLHELMVLPTALRPLLPITPAWRKMAQRGRTTNDPILKLLSDVNQLYRLVLVRHMRLRRQQQVGTPEVILAAERAMVRDAVAGLMANEILTKANRSCGPRNRALHSLGATYFPEGVEHALTTSPLDAITITVLRAMGFAVTTQ